LSAFTFIVDCILPYFSFTVLGVGTIYRLWKWFSIPLPLRIGLSPIPTTQRGIIGRIAAEIFLFRTFFNSERAFWFIVWPFHVAGLLTLINHLLGLSDGLIQAYLPHIVIPQLATVLFVLAFAAWLLIALLLYILIRRLYKVEIRRMSFFSDYIAVVLILALVSMGAYMAFFTETDMTAVAKWGTGLMTLRPVSVGNVIFSIHFLIAQALFIYFPFSKLFHPLGQIASRMMTQKEELLNPEGTIVK
jgi:nitrate reductase gamma subunit